MDKKKLHSVEEKMVKLEDSIRKAKYMVSSSIENYDLNEIPTKNTEDALKFAFRKEDIGNSADIAYDYIVKAYDLCEDIKKEVMEL